MDKDKVFKRKLIETYLAFDKFCTENNILYFGVGGTAIGAVRHKGFIPWDDDIDVCMLRKDYDRFVSLKESCNKNEFAIIDYHDKGNPAVYAKFINMNTTLVEFDYNPYSSGLFIDVFPLDNVASDVDDVKILKDKIMSDVALYQRSAFDLCFRDILRYIAKGHLNTVARVLANKIVYRHKYSEYVKLLENDENMLRGIEGENVLNYFTFYKLEREIFPKEWFSSAIEVPFENVKMKIPVGYHEYLTKLFGDYMTPPPVNQQVSHHSHYYCNLKEHISMKEIRHRLANGERFVY